jgi:hypothetical protein
MRRRIPWSNFLFGHPNQVLLSASWDDALVRARGTSVMNCVCCYLLRRLQWHDVVLLSVMAAWIPTFRHSIMPLFVLRLYWHLWFGYSGINAVPLYISRRFGWSYIHALLSPETSGDTTAQHYISEAYTFVSITVRATDTLFASASCYSCCSFRFNIVMRNLIRRSVRENGVKRVGGEGGLNLRLYVL